MLSAVRVSCTEWKVITAQGTARVTLKFKLDFHKNLNLCVYEGSCSNNNTSTTNNNTPVALAQYKITVK